MRWIGSWWALIGLMMLWSLVFGSVALGMLSAVDSACGPYKTDATTWCEGWLRLYDNVLVVAVVVAWLLGLVVVIVVWAAIRRRRGGRRPPLGYSAGESELPSSASRR